MILAAGPTAPTATTAYKRGFRNSLGYDPILNAGCVQTASTELVFVAFHCK